jgi:hypothetical protein
LTDVSLAPSAPVVGAAINFTLGSAQCSDVTDANGIATCQLVPGAVGMETLTAVFAGSSQLLASTDVVSFNILAAPPGDDTCPRSHGYWKTHPAAWPVTSLPLGDQTYSKAELLSLLKRPSAGDASIILAHQLIAAKLNIANGSDPDPVSATITDADQRLSAFSGKLPYKVKPSSAAGQAMVARAEELDDYNNGALTPDCHND